MTRRRDDDLPMSKRPPVDEDVRREIEFHIERRAAELVTAGVPRERAMAEARASFGDRAAVEAECRDIEERRRTTRHRASRLAEFRQDVAVGWRVLKKSPGFTVAAVVTLALGVGANSAVFSLVNRLLLQPLPYAHADRLVTIDEQHAKGYGNIPWPNFVDVKAQNATFDAMAQYGGGMGTLLAGGSALRVREAAFSQGLFDVLEVRPVMGRLPLPAEHQIGAPAVAVVSYPFWRDVLGAPASLNGVRVKGERDYAVIGVLPPGFAFNDATQVWFPLEVEPLEHSRTSHNRETIGRMKAGVTLDAAQRDLGAVFAHLASVYQPDFDATGARMYGLRDALYGSMRTPLYLLLGASGVLLLAACANLAGAQLARGSARAGEFAIRSALGAGRGRLLRQLVAESALLAFLGAVAGLALSFAILRGFTAIAPSSLPIASVSIDGWVLAFAAVAAVLTTVLVGALPALRLSGDDAGLALREGTRGTGGVSRMRAWKVLVAAEVAIAVVLLTGSTLLIKSFSRVMDQQLGFDPASALAVRVALPGVNYDGPNLANVMRFHDQSLERIRSAPGVASVGFANALPLAGGGPSGGIAVEGKPADPNFGSTGYAIYRVVGGDYFEAAGIPVVAGEVFSSRRSLPPNSVVVDQAFATREWPNENPIGKRMRVVSMDHPRDFPEPWLTVVGVVASVRPASVTGDFRPTYFMDFHERPMYRVESASYVVRTTGSVTAIASVVRNAMRAVDPDVAIEAAPLQDIVSRSVNERRFTMIVLGTFAAVALLLAIAGVYAVISYAVAQRRREIGIRLALGATRGRVRTMVLGSAAAAIAPGLLLGAAGAIAAARALATLVYGVSPSDPPSLALALAALGVAGLLSGLLPAVRATRVDPLLAIRMD
ncbi:MAG TPA: ADOP family duplicated permease [Gemmatimonadaceae bacterium]|nr:ADOP family duplicated permease [Gemmatimonadaceae bacterium]